MSDNRPRSAQRESGMVLVAVLWITAALVLLVSGLSGAARGDVRGVSDFRAQVAAEALADGAILLAARDVAQQQVPGNTPLAGKYSLDGQVIELLASPASGWINLNRARAPLLTAMLVHLAGLASEDATALAAAIVDWRDIDQTPMPAGAEDDDYVRAGSAYRTRSGRFAAPEDLLQVLGMSYEVFDKIRDSVSVLGSDTGGVNPLAAPPEVLAVLAAGDWQLGERFAARRNELGDAVDLAGLTAEFVDRGSPGGYRMDARVRIDGRKTLQKVAWLRIDRAARPGKQITIVRNEQVRLLTSN